MSIELLLIAAGFVCGVVAEIQAAGRSLLAYGVIFIGAGLLLPYIK